MSLILNALMLVAAALLVVGAPELSGRCSTSNVDADASSTRACELMQSLGGFVAAERPVEGGVEPVAHTQDAMAVPEPSGAEASPDDDMDAGTPDTTTDAARVAEPGTEAREARLAAATRDEQRRALRSADALAEAAAVADSLAARLTEERRALAQARKAVADADAASDASESVAVAAKVAARRAAAAAEAERETARSADAELAQVQQRNARLQQEIAEAVARAAAQESELRALEREADQRATAVAEAKQELADAQETQLAQVQQQSARQREVADAMMRASAHHEALRALEREADQLAMSVAEAERLSIERDAAAAAAEEDAQANSARLEAAEARAADLQRAADAAETKADLQQAELDAAQRAAAETDRAIAAVEERAARMKVRSAAAEASLERQIARLSEVNDASEGLRAVDDDSAPAGAPTSLLAYAETVSPLISDDATIANGTNGGDADRVDLATPAEPSPEADRRRVPDSDLADERGGEEARGLQARGPGSATPPQAEPSTEADLRIGAPAAEPGEASAEDVAETPLALQSLAERSDADRRLALTRADPAQEDTLALASYGRTDATAPSAADPVFSAVGVGTVRLSAEDATLHFEMAEDVVAELTFGGPEDFNRGAAAVAANNVSEHYSRVFESAFVTSGVDDDADHPGYYTLGLTSSGRSAILRLRFAATPAAGAPQAVREVVNAAACSALFGSAALPCREQQLRTDAAQR